MEEREIITKKDEKLSFFVFVYSDYTGVKYDQRNIIIWYLNPMGQDQYKPPPKKMSLEDNIIEMKMQIKTL